MNLVNNKNLVEKVTKVQRDLVDALRVVIAAAGSLHYATYEHLQPLNNELKSIDSNQRTPYVLDLKKDMEKIIKNVEALHQRIKIRFVADGANDVFENISFGIFQCIVPLSVMPENDIYQEAMRLSDRSPRYAQLSEQVKFMDRVLEKARQSNYDAIRMLQERRDVLESLNAQPILVGDDGVIQVYDIAPEREEVDNMLDIEDN